MNEPIPRSDAYRKFDLVKARQVASKLQPASHQHAALKEMLCSLSSPKLSGIKRFLVREHAVDDFQEFRHTRHQGSFLVFTARD